MKLNKTLMIAALVAGSVFAADMAVLAQDSTNKPAVAPPAPGRGRMNFDSVSTQLALTDDQKTKAKPVFEEMMQKMAEVRRDTAMEAADKRTKTTEIRNDANAKLKDIFTAEQFDKWQKMNQGGRRPAGGGPPPPAGGTPPAPPADAKAQQ